MKELDFLKNDRVKAPDDFEKKVLILLSEKKKKKKKVRLFQLSLAGAVGTVGVILLVVNLFFFQNQSPQEIAEKGPQSILDLGEYFQFGHENRIPITEAVDYSGEIRVKTDQSRTIYILEQVSDSTDTHIKY
ncbi:MAG: hypothetical protein GF421_10045 [Candidatus Aminicenantes bacterium]|nr:hypothetical protein [Candidatus Aminicenantes bacterium]